MKYRRFGRLGWQVSEIGYGMWGMAGWTGSDDDQSRQALARAVALGCNFFDTAAAYGGGHSERLLGELVRAHPGIYTASKIPPKNGKFPALPEYPLDQAFPADHIRASIERTLENVGRIDLIQLHVWDDGWAGDERWQRALDDARREGLVRGVGISVNRWEPANVLRALRTGVVDAVQVVYNIFDQNPEDQLFPLCRERDLAIIARVPFDEGGLTGALEATTRWPDGDWRNIYFGGDSLRATVERAARVKAVVPPGSTMPQLALRFILASDAVSTVIPGMRKISHVEANVAASDAPPLDGALLDELRRHRWVRTRARPTG